MPEHLRALVVILTFAVAVFVMAKGLACANAIRSEDYERRRNLWFALTLVVFLAHNYWIYILAAAFLLYAVSQGERNKLAMYLFLLFAVPAISAEIPGMGLINYFFEIDYVRLLALTVLLPTYLFLRRQPGVEPFGRLMPDKVLLGYLILGFVLLIAYSTFTNTLRRGVFYAFIDIFLPYYVASRSLRSLQDFRDAMMSYVVAALVLSPILFFEFFKFWLLYLPVEYALGVNWGWNNYLTRGGNLRASGSIGHAIVAGYAVAIALAFYMYLRVLVTGRVLWGLGLALLAAGVLAPLSRGPWLGAAAMLMILAATGRAPVLGMAKLGMLALLVVPVIVGTRAGSVIIDHLPFVGTIDARNVEGRQHLAEVSVQVFLDNPLLGSPNYIDTPAIQALRGPDGIIDLVNTYVIVGLGSGAVGLVLFVGFFLTVILSIHAAIRSFADREDERCLLGRTLLAVMLGIMLIIATVSPVLIVPTMYWIVAGLGVAYIRMIARGSDAAVKGPSELIANAAHVA